MALAGLKRELEQGTIRPAYVLLGPEELAQREALALLKKHVLTPEALALNYSEFSAQDVSCRRIIEAAATLPMMSRHRMVVVTELEKMKEDQRAEMIEFLGRHGDRNVLVFTSSELDKRTTFFRSLKDRTCLLEFPKLKQYDLERRSEEIFRSQGLRVSQASVRKLVDLAGSDLQTLKNEIEKIALFCSDKNTVPDAAVDALVRASRQHTVFELTGALGRRERKRALSLLGNLLEAGESPIMIVNLCARHFRQILIAKDLLHRSAPKSAISTAAQVPAFALDEFLAQVGAMDLKTAEVMYQRLALADQRFKSSSVDERMVLEKLICAL